LGSPAFAGGLYKSCLASIIIYAGGVQNNHSLISEMTFMLFLLDIFDFPCILKLKARKSMFI